MAASAIRPSAAAASGIHWSVRAAFTTENSPRHRPWRISASWKTRFSRPARGCASSAVRIIAGLTSMPTTAPGLTRRAISAVSVPGPDPTSSTDVPRRSRGGARDGTTRGIADSGCSGRRLARCRRGSSAWCESTDAGVAAQGALVLAIPREPIVESPRRDRRAGRRVRRSGGRARGPARLAGTSRCSGSSDEPKWGSPDRENPPRPGWRCAVVDRPALVERRRICAGPHQPRYPSRPDVESVARRHRDRHHLSQARGDLPQPDLGAGRPVQPLLGHEDVQRARRLRPAGRAEQGLTGEQHGRGQRRRRDEERPAPHRRRAARRPAPRRERGQRQRLPPGRGPPRRLGGLGDHRHRAAPRRARRRPQRRLADRSVRERRRVLREQGHDEPRGRLRLPHRGRDRGRRLPVHRPPRGRRRADLPPLRRGSELRARRGGQQHVRPRAVRHLLRRAGVHRPARRLHPEATTTSRGASSTARPPEGRGRPSTARPRATPTAGSTRSTGARATTRASGPSP